MIRFNKTIHANTVNRRKYMIFFWNPQLFLSGIAIISPKKKLIQLWLFSIWPFLHEKKGGRDYIVHK